MIHITKLINDTDTLLILITILQNTSLIELPTLYVKIIISFLGIKCIQTVNIFPLGFLVYYSGLDLGLVGNELERQF